MRILLTTENHTYYYNKQSKKFKKTGDEKL